MVRIHLTVGAGLPFLKFYGNHYNAIIVQILFALHIYIELCVLARVINDNTCINQEREMS